MGKKSKSKLIKRCKVDFINKFLEQHIFFLKQRIIESYNAQEERLSKTYEFEN